MRRPRARVLRSLLLLAAALSQPQAGGGDPLLRAAAQIEREAYDPALRTLAEAALLADGKADPALAARLEQLTGNALAGRGEIREASTHHERALALARSAGHRRLEAAILADVGSWHHQRAEYREAEERLRRSLAIRTEAGDRAGEAESRDRLGRVLLKQGRYDDALAILKGALAVQEQIGETRGQAETLLDIAMLHTDRRAFNRALHTAARSLGLYEAVGSAAGQVRVLCSIAAIYFFQEAPREALERLDRALEVADAEGDRSLRAKVLYHMAGAHLIAGRPIQAIESYDEALPILEEDGNAREAAWAMARRGNALRGTGRLAEAEASYARALATWERIQERRPQAYYLYVLGRLQEERGDDEAALRSYRLAIGRQEAVHLPYTSLLLSDMALLVQRHGDPAGGLELARRAVRAAEETGNPEMRWSAHYGLGRLLRRIDRREEALPSLRESLDIIESMRHEVAPSDEARTGFMESKQEVYAETISLLFDLGHPEEALEVAERARARAFLDLLSERPEAGARRRPSQAPIRPARLPEIRGEAMRRRTTLVAYFVSETDLFAWVATPGGTIHGVRTPLGRAELERMVGAMEGALGRGPFSGPARGAPPEPPLPEAEELDPLLARLHRALLSPVERWLPTDPASEVTIIPHGALFRVAFGGLRNEQGRYVAEAHTLHYTPAVGVLHYTGSKRFSRRGDWGAARLLAVGADAAGGGSAGRPGMAALPGAAEEVRSIAALWPAGRSTVLLGERAREAAVRDLAPRHAVLHLAGHGVMMDDSPLKSFVALAGGAEGDPDDDGELSVSEVLDLRLRADLVTLSACDTGLGPITGDGVLGLSRAFVYAGASSVVVSLWRVADVVGRYQMERFYEALAAGSDKASALRRAQLATLAALRRGDLRDGDGRVLRDTPALWAPFVLIGEPR